MTIAIRIVLLLLFCNKIYAINIYDKSMISHDYVKDIIIINPENLYTELRSILKIAEFNKLPISARGSSHSQGGHIIAYNGFVLDLSKCNKIKMISDDIVRVDGGVIWKDLVEFLNKKDLSVSIMQSDFDFSISGSISTNVHGWQINKPPIIDSIEGFHIMLANGNIIYSTAQNKYSELFYAVIGGYGLFGVILDIDLKVIDNDIYEIKSNIILSSDIINKFQELRNNDKSRMFFGRFNLDKKKFLNEMLFVQYQKSDKKKKSSELKELGKIQDIVQYLFDKTYDNNFMRKLRWSLETSSIISKFIKHLTRNQLLYHSVDTYTTREQSKTDLLQEYFIPIEQSKKFMETLKDMKSELQPHLMNITLRQVNKDDKSLLTYANEDMFCFVIFFRGNKNQKFDDHIRNISLKLTDAALNLNGKYYLPYRPYQTIEQFKKSYPNYKKFKAIKLKYDPNEIFQNQFYKNYLNNL